jgi:hypothetical protein
MMTSGVLGQFHEKDREASTGGFDVVEDYVMVSCIDDFNYIQLRSKGSPWHLCL